MATTFQFVETPKCPTALPTAQRGPASLRTGPPAQRDHAGDAGHGPFDGPRQFPDRLKTYPTTGPWRRTSSLSNSQVSNRVADRATWPSVIAHRPTSATGCCRGFRSWAVRWPTSLPGQVENLSYDTARCDELPVCRTPKCQLVLPTGRRGRPSLRTSHPRNGMLPGIRVMGRSMVHVDSRTGWKPILRPARVVELPACERTSHERDRWHPVSHSPALPVARSAGATAG